MPTLNGLINNLVVGDDIDIERTITNVPEGDSLVKAWFTVKARETDPDINAIFQKTITASYVAGQGEITDDGAGDQQGAVTFELTNVDTLLLVGDTAYYYDLQVKTANAKIYTPEKGQLTMRKQITVATS